MHSTRGRIRNNLHVQCSVCSLWGTLLLCLWVQVKLKPISIYLFGCTHTDLISLFHSCLLVMTDATYCLVRMGVTIYRWSMNVVVGHPLERLPCFGSQSSFSGYALTKGSNPVDFLAFHLSFSVFHVQRKIVICATQITSFFFKKTNPYY